MKSKSKFVELFLDFCFGEEKVFSISRSSGPLHFVKLIFASLYLVCKLIIRTGANDIKKLNKFTVIDIRLKRYF